eukprot:4212714-Alexandrium_andersonii.AAC.1
MKVLYGARMARPDLLKCVCSLASRVNHWGPAESERLHRLMCYIAQSKDCLLYTSPSPRD